MMDSVRCRLVIPGVRLAGTDHGAGGEGLDWSLQGAQHVSNSVIQLTHSPGDHSQQPSQDTAAWQQQTCQSSFSFFEGITPPG